MMGVYMAGQARGRIAGQKRSDRASRGENRAAMIVVLCVVCVLFGVLLFEGVRLSRRIGDNEERRLKLEEAIEEESKRTESIESLREYMQSEEYIRQLARDRLGLVDEDELILKAAR